MAITKKTRNIILIIIAIAIVTVIVLLIIKAKNKKEQEEAAEEVKQAYSPAPAASGKKKPSTGSALSRLFNSLPSGKFPIQPGSKDKFVFLLQKMLKEMWSEPVDIDGSWGKQTTSAFDKHYQAKSLNQNNFYALMYQYKSWLEKNKQLTAATDAFFKSVQG